MSYTPITSFSNSGDTYVNKNTNSTVGYAHVQAFIAKFKSYASDASSRLNGLPSKFVLAIWAEESGWGRNDKQVNAQNWANITYTDSTHPESNTGYYTSGSNKFCTFKGVTGFTNGFVTFFTKRKDPNSDFSKVYQQMLDYAKNTSNPDARTLATYLYNAHFNTSSSFVDLVVSTYNTVVSHYDEV